MVTRLAVVAMSVVLICGIESRKADAQTLLARLDSMKTSEIKEDSLQKQVKNFNTSLDSLNHFRDTPNVYIQKLDSSYKSFKQRILTQFSHGKDSVSRKVDERVVMIDSALRKKCAVLDSLTKSKGFEGFSPEQLTEKINPSITDLDVPGVELGSPGIGLQIPTIPDLPLKNPGVSIDVEAAGSLPNELDQLNDVEDLAPDIEKISSEAERIQGMNTETLEKTSEGKLHEMDEVKRIGGEKKKVDALDKQAKSLKKLKGSPDSVRTMVKKEFVDHFAGKEEKIKNDLASIAKMQVKYRTFGDSRLLPKHPPNEMKGKPFVERLIPGITFQVFTQENVSVDVSPFIGYRFSGKFNAGLGGYKRITYFSKSDHLQAVNCYGFRFFASHKIVKKFSFYSELECYRNYTASGYGGLYGFMRNQHHWKWNFGFQNRYSIGRRFYGNFIVMYDLVKIKRFPNTEGAAVRFGIDYLIKNRKKKLKNIPTS